jgi:CHAT domain-containing protein
VLSACDTAAGVSGTLGRLSGQDESAATLDGLVRAFITARARAVLATYWNVPASLDTDHLIQIFYGSGRLYDMATALRTAQTRLIGQPQTSHPYFWGAYVLIGDGSKSMLSPKDMTTASR